jgi:lon-related putative ATP-dependent protease
MPIIEPLPFASLYRSCDPQQFTFQTTAELEGPTEPVGQTRAVEATNFGLSMHRDGYNLFVLGPPGLGKHALVRQMIESRAIHETKPSDWCYVNNFNEANKPIALKLPAGQGYALRADMAQLVEELTAAIPAGFDSDRYRSGVEAIQQEFADREEKSFTELGDTTAKQGIAFMHGPDGFFFLPIKKDGENMNHEEFEKLPEAEKERINKLIEGFQTQLQKLLIQMPRWRREQHQRLRQFNRETVMNAIAHLFEELREKYRELPDVLEYLAAIHKDAIDNAPDIKPTAEKISLDALGASGSASQRYAVNIISGHDGDKGVPVIYEDHPTFQNLIGRSEHIAQMGLLMTNFTLIKAGALHRANGGYLMLDAHKLLTQPYAWDGLKRALFSNEIRIESLGQTFGLVSTVSLEPQPIPLNTKVVLFGDRFIYYLLSVYDPDFSELFKVAVDFDEEIERSSGHDQLYARLIAALAQKEALNPFDRNAVARVIEYSARVAGDAEKLTTHMQSIADLLAEADHQANGAGRSVVMREDVQAAIDGQLRRADRLPKQYQEAMLRGIQLIDTEGEQVAQVNGLAAIDLGTSIFAHPVRITATTRLGEGEMIDIEREVDLSGPIHSKGVLILSSFLASRYSSNTPHSLNASLVFEQTYGKIEGDSASLAELCALLSSLGDLPIRQSLGVTGSVNQFGEVQPIGAVNEKIEGFFDICKARGTLGDQGVLIPASNVNHLMLRDDVVEACKQGSFHIYAVSSVDEAIELLTGVAVGVPDSKGNLPAGTVNYLVALRLAELSLIRQAYGGGSRVQVKRKKKRIPQPPTPKGI